jgi:HEAT repeat protein
MSRALPGYLRQMGLSSWVADYLRPWRSIAASQLARIEDRRVVDALIPLLHDDEGWVREAAAGGLGQQRDPRALEPLRELLRRERKDMVVKKTAKRAVSDLERAASEASG